MLTASLIGGGVLAGIAALIASINDPDEPRKMQNIPQPRFRVSWADIAWGLILAVVMITALLFMLLTGVFAQEHHHPPQDAQLHNEFYSKLMRPDVPNSSCCNNQDCYPTKAKFVGGRWWALRREDSQWIPVPAGKVIPDRSPDGRAHLCAPDPERAASYWKSETFLFCFVQPEAGT